MTESRESRVWGDEGVEPDPGEETYEGGERPIAEYDNWAMWSVTNDIETLFAWLDTVEDDLDTHIADDTNPHNVTEEQTGAAASLTAHEDSTTDVHGIEGEDSVAGVSDIETHRETEVHDEPQPAQTHGNEAHSETFVTNDEGVTEFAVGTLQDGEALVNEGGVLTGSDEIGGGDAETDIDLIEVATLDELPDPENVEDPTIAYVDEEDDYLGVFQE